MKSWKFPLEEKKNQNLKAPVTPLSHKLKGKRKKNLIIPELNIYSSVYNRTLFYLLFETGLIWSLH